MRIADDHKRKSLVLAALASVPQPASVPEVVGNCKGYSLHQVGATLKVLEDEGSVRSAGEATGRRWSTSSAVVPMQAQPAPPQEPQRPLMTLEVWPDSVRMSHSDAASMLDALR